MVVAVWVEIKVQSIENCWDSGFLGWGAGASVVVAGEVAVDNIWGNRRTRLKLSLNLIF